MNSSIPTIVTEPIKRRIKVTIEYKMIVTLMPSLFGGMSVEKYLEEFRKGLWDVDDINDIAKYAAQMAALYGETNEDGIGTLSPAYLNKDTFVKYDIIDEDINSEII